MFFLYKQMIIELFLLFESPCYQLSKLNKNKIVVCYFCFSKKHTNSEDCNTLLVKKILIITMFTVRENSKFSQKVREDVYKKFNVCIAIINFYSLNDNRVYFQ